MDKPMFVCSYQGESDWLWKGRRIHKRCAAADWIPGYWNYTPEEYLAQRVALVGCIHCSPVGEFPPVELEQFFPGYVRARFNTTDWTVEYADGKRPETIHSAVYKETLALVWAKELGTYSEPIAELAGV